MSLPFPPFSYFNVPLEVFRVKIKFFKMGFQLKKHNSPHLSFYKFGVENLGVKATASHISVLLTYVIIHGRSEEVELRVKLMKSYFFTGTISWKHSFGVLYSSVWSILITKAAVIGQVRSIFLYFKYVLVSHHVWLWVPMNCSLPSFFGHVILQARILEWVAIPFFRYFKYKSQQSRDITNVFDHPKIRVFLCLWFSRYSAPYWVRAQSSFTLQDY